MSASRLKQSTKRHNANINMAYGCEKDNNTYCYRMTNGHKHLHRIILGYGWENTPFDVTKLSCYEKGEGTMGNGRKPAERPNDEELRVVYERVGGSIDGVRKQLKTSYGTAKEWLVGAGIIDTYGTPRLPAKNEQPQTSEPKGDQPEPAQSEASATDILPQYAPTDNDYNESGQEREAGTQRTTLTRAQYDAMAMNDDRMSALAIFCENQAVEQLRQDWAVSVFKHSRLSRERKLELIGQLLDWRAEE